MAERGAIPAVVLASASRPRAALLTGAGIAFTTDPPAIDEAAVKASIRGEGGSAAAAAEALAALKAQQVSRRHPGALVIGADQMLECGAAWFDKPTDPAQARRHLKALRGQAHDLISAVAVVRDGTVLWHHVERATLTMRPFSEAFLDDYLARAGESARRSVGVYEMEGLGIQLFSRIDGDYFAILGLPLLPILDFLRGHGVIQE